MLADEEICKIYREKTEHPERIINAYNLAIGDYMKGPVIERVNPDEYTGQPDERMVVFVTDNFKVKEVIVEILQSGGMLGEKGNTFPNYNGLDWEYTTQFVNMQISGSIVTVSVYDRPINIATK